MKNLEITGRMGVTTVAKNGGNVPICVEFSQVFPDTIRMSYPGKEPIYPTIDELREIVARWDAGV